MQFLQRQPRFSHVFLAGLLIVTLLIVNVLDYRNLPWKERDVEQSPELLTIAEQRQQVEPPTYSVKFQKHYIDATGDGDARFDSQGPQRFEELKNRFINGGTLPDDLATENIRWGYDNSSLASAAAKRTGKGVTVAILDTGLDESSSMAPRNQSVANDLLDNDSFAQDRPDFEDNDGNNSVDEAAGHGSHIASVIAMAASDVNIMPIRVLNSDGTGVSEEVARGIRYAVDNGAQIVNMSLSGPIDTPALREAVQYAQERDVLLIAAANGDNNGLYYPAGYEGVIAVGSINSKSEPSDFVSPYGNYIDVFAPGEKILSGYHGGLFAVLTGNSMATAFVSAQAALIRQNAGCNAECTRSAILQHVNPVVSPFPLAGRIDAVSAISATADDSVTLTTGGGFTLWQNGGVVSSSEQAVQALQIDLELGAQDTLALEVMNRGDLPGIMAELKINGSLVGSDEGWQISNKNPEGWQNPGAVACDWGKLPRVNSDGWMWMPEHSATEPLYLRYNINGNDCISIAANGQYIFWVNGQYRDFNLGEWRQAKSHWMDLSIGDVLAIEIINTGNATSGILTDLIVDGERFVSDETWRMTTNLSNNNYLLASLYDLFSVTGGASWQSTQIVPSFSTRAGYRHCHWPFAVEHGRYGSAPWNGSIEGMSDDTSASWLWAADLERVDTIMLRYVIGGADGCDVSVDNQNGQVAQISPVAYQSSTADGGVAERAIDGNYDRNFADGSVTKTQFEWQPWWELDLGTSYEVDSINIWNHAGCCQGDLGGYYVLISDIPFQSQELREALAQPGVHAIYYPSSSSTDNLSNGQIDGVGDKRVNIHKRGRYIRIQLVGENQLSLAEVDLLGYPVSQKQQPIFNTPTHQLSTNGDQIDLPIDAFDFEGQRLIFEASTLPVGLQIDPDEGVVYGTVSEDVGTTGRQKLVKIKASTLAGVYGYSYLLWSIYGEINVAGDNCALESGSSFIGNDTLGQLSLRNQLTYPVDIYALDAAGERYLRFGLDVGEENTISTFGTYAWLIARRSDGACIHLIPDPLQEPALILRESQENTSNETIAIWARGDAGGEKMQLVIDGQTVQTWLVSDVFQSYEYAYNEVVDISELRIEFVNDGIDPESGQNLNLVVDKVVVNGLSYETEAPETFAYGVWTGSDCVTPGYFEVEMLACNGYFEFDIESGVVSEPTSTPTPIVPPTFTPTPNIEATPTFTRVPPTPTPTQVSNDELTPTPLSPPTIAPTSANEPTPTLNPDNTNSVLRCDGIDDLAHSDSIPLGDAFTIELWMNPSMVSGTNVIFEQSGVSGGIALDIVDGQLTFWRGDKSAWQSWAHPETITAGYWYHVALVYDGEDTIVLYLNGESGGTWSIGAVSSALEFTLCGYADYAYFTGLIDNFYVAKTAKFTDNFSPSIGLPQIDQSAYLLWDMEGNSEEYIWDIANWHNGRLRGFNATTPTIQQALVSSPPSDSSLNSAQPFIQNRISRNERSDKIWLPYISN